MLVVIGFGFDRSVGRYAAADLPYILSTCCDEQVEEGKAGAKNGGRRMSALGTVVVEHWK